MATEVVIGLSAVVIAIKDGEAAALTVRPRGHGAVSPVEGLPFGPFDPDGHRTFEIALREFVTRQTRFELGFVEQLYTFGDKGREAPLADVGAGAARVISVDGAFGRWAGNRASGLSGVCPSQAGDTYVVFGRGSAL